MSQRLEPLPVAAGSASKGRRVRIRRNQVAPSDGEESVSPERGRRTAQLLAPLKAGSIIAGKARIIRRGPVLEESLSPSRSPGDGGLMRKPPKERKQRRGKVVSGGMVDFARTGRAPPPDPGVRAVDARAAVAAERNDRWDMAMFIGENDSQEHNDMIAKLIEQMHREGLEVLQHFLPDTDTDETGVPMLLLLTASDREMMEEAELMPLMKAVEVSKAVCDKYHLPIGYSKIFAPFNSRRAHLFYEEPHNAVGGTKISVLAPQKGTLPAKTHDFDSADVIKRRFDSKNDAAQYPPGSHKPKKCKCNLKYFSECERQILIEHIIESQLTKVFQRTKVDIQFFPLHDDDGDGGHDLKFLLKKWVNIFEFSKIMSLINPFRNPNLGVEQPIDDIRNYFGDHVGFYFAFLGFYTKWLCYPAAFGVIMFVLQRTQGTENAFMPVYCLLLSCWSFIFVRFWERSQNTLAYRWGTRDLKEEVRVRREFKPRTETAKRSPKSARRFKYLAGTNVLMMMLGCVIASFLTFFIYWASIVGELNGLGPTIGGVFHALAIIVLNGLYRKVALTLNDWENHKTRETYENRFIQKVFCFEFVNNFMSLFYVAFFRDWLTTASGGTEPTTSTMDELSMKLGTIFGSRFVVNNVQEVMLPWVKRKMAAIQESRLERMAAKQELKAGAGEMDTIARARDLSQRRKSIVAASAFDAKGKIKDYVEKASEELKRPAYDSTLDDYNELVIQFAFVVLFGVAFPLTGALAMISNYLELWVDSFKLCTQFRRPVAERAAGIPKTWLNILQWISVLGIFTNVALIVLATDFLVDMGIVPKYIVPTQFEIDCADARGLDRPAEKLNEPSTASQWLGAFIFEHIIIFVRLLFGSMVLLTPKQVSRKERINRRILRDVIAEGNSQQDEIKAQNAHHQEAPPQCDDDQHVERNEANRVFM